MCVCDHVELGQVSTSSFEPRCTEGKHASIDHFSGLRIQTTPCPGAFIPTRLALFDVQLTRQHWQPCPGTRRRSRNTSVWPRHHTAPSFEHLARLSSKHGCLCIFSRTCRNQSKPCSCNPEPCLMCPTGGWYLWHRHQRAFSTAAILRTFCMREGIDLVIRSHQFVRQGYKACGTIWRWKIDMPMDFQHV